MSLSSIHITMLILSLLLVCAFFILSLYSAYIPVNNSFSCCHCHTLFSSLPKPVLTWMSLVCNLLFLLHAFVTVVFWPLSLFFKLHSFDCHLFASSCVTLSLMDLHHLESSCCLPCFVLSCCVFSILCLSVLPSARLFYPSDISCPEGSVFLVVFDFSSCVFSHLCSVDLLYVFCLLVWLCVCVCLVVLYLQCPWLVRASLCEYVLSI